MSSVPSIVNGVGTIYDKYAGNTYITYNGKTFPTKARVSPLSINDVIRRCVVHSRKSWDFSYKPGFYFRNGISIYAGNWMLG